MVFYDLTSTYFEGSGPAGPARHGYSRDGKPRLRQVLVGVVRVDGWPIAHHVFRGNLRDAQTVEPVLEDLRRRFGLQRVVFVGDRGMMTSENLDRIRSRGQGYLLGLKRRRNEQVRRYIEQAQGPWQDCPAGITAREKSVPPRTRVQGSGGRGGGRAGVCGGQRAAPGVRTGAAGKGHGGAAEAAGATLDGSTRPLSFATTSIRYTASVRRRWREVSDPDRGAAAGCGGGGAALPGLDGSRAGFPRPQGRDRDAADLSSHEAASGGAHFRGGVGAAKHAIGRKLQQAGLDLSVQEALGALATVQLLDLELPQGESKRLVTRGSRRAQQVLKALGISDRRPPGDPAQKPRM